LLATIWITIRNGRRQLRAYIGVTTRELPTLQLGYKQRGEIILTNYGQTPAFNVKYRGELKIISAKDRFALPKFRTDMIPVNPQQTIPTIYETGSVLTAAEEAAVRAGRSLIYLYGEIKYRDAFGRRRVTTYRFMYGGERLIREGAWVVCETGNREK
jgi:hypothetical protein